MSKELKLTDREWGEFFVKDLFRGISRGSRLNQRDREEGDIPLITAGEEFNGISSFISNVAQREFCPAITLDMFANAFYQGYKFKCDDNISVLNLDNSVSQSKYIYLFLVVALSRLKEKYSYAKQVRPHRLTRERLLLPIQSDGTPDWEFMSAFMQRVEHETLSKALAFFRSKECDNMLRGGGKMQPFYIGDVLSIENGVRLTKADMCEGIRPFIGASESNNGVTGFINNTNSSLASNILGVNYNGSVGFSFYHPYEALFSDDVKRVRWKDEEANNKYTLLYLSTAISQQKGKYAYGYKFNAQRMKRQLILLPVLDDGALDYALMEHTMRVMEYAALRKYMSQMAV